MLAILRLACKALSSPAKSTDRFAVYSSISTLYLFTEAVVLPVTGIYALSFSRLV